VGRSFHEGGGERKWYEREHGCGWIVLWARGIPQLLKELECPLVTVLGAVGEDSNAGDRTPLSMGIVLVIVVDEVVARKFIANATVVDAL
jgi:hypothetical protein